MFSGAAIADAEDNNLTGVTFTVSGVADDEELSFDGTAITLADGETETTGAGHTLSAAADGGNFVVTVTLASRVDATALSALIDGVEYQNVTARPTAGDRTITVSDLVDDGGTDNGGVDTSTTTASATITVLEAPLLADVALSAVSDTGAANDDGITNDTTPTIQFRAEGGATVAINWGDPDVPPTTMTADGAVQSVMPDGATPYLNDGDKTITITIDDGGSISRETITLTLDTVVPALNSIELQAPNADGAPSVAFMAEEGASLEVDWDDGNGFVALADPATGAAQTITRATAFDDAEDRTIQVRATNTAGNFSELPVESDIGAAPTLAITGADLNADENVESGALFPDVTVGHGDGDVTQTISSLTFTVAGVVDGEEILTVDGEAFTLSAASTGQNSVGNYVVALDGATATVTLSGLSLSATETQTLIESVIYRHNEDDSTAGDRTITLSSLTDSGRDDYGSVNSVTSEVAATVTVASVNDAPVAEADGTDPQFVISGASVDLFNDVSISAMEAAQDIL